MFVLANLDWVGSEKVKAYLCLLLLLSRDTGNLVGLLFLAPCKGLLEVLLESTSYLRVENIPNGIIGTTKDQSDETWKQLLSVSKIIEHLVEELDSAIEVLVLVGRP